MFCNCLRFFYSNSVSNGANKGRANYSKIIFQTLGAAIDQERPLIKKYFSRFENFNQSLDFSPTFESTMQQRLFHIITGSSNSILCGYSSRAPTIQEIIFETHICPCGPYSRAPFIGASTVPHLKVLVGGNNASSSQWCGCIFIM